MPFRRTRDLIAELSPADLGSQLGKWLRADRIGAADGASISAWGDSSGNGNNASSAGVFQPTMKLGVNGVNGMPAANFSAAGTDSMALVDGATIHPATLTLGAIFRQNGSAQYCHLFSRWYSASWSAPYASYSLVLNDDLAHTPEFDVTIAGTRKPCLATGYTYPSGLVMLIGVYDGVNQNLYGNGKLIKSLAQTGAVDYTYATTNNYLGQQSGGYYVNLDLAECFIASAITERQRRGIELRWARQYGVQLAA